MIYEVEQKFRVANSFNIERILLEVGATIRSTLYQKDIYVSHPARDFRLTDEALRLRHEGESNYITYKGPKIDKSTKTRVEIEVRLPDGNEFSSKFSDLLSAIGFAAFIEVEKRRRTAQVLWHGADITVSLDEVTHLGVFVELEITANEEDVDSAKQSIASLALKLGLFENERRSYSELMRLHHQL